MKIVEIKDQPDGSAIVEVDMTEAEQNMLIEIGFLQVLREGIERIEKEHADNFRTPIPE